jgi:hypothetical protein
MNDDLNDAITKALDTTLDKLLPIGRRHTFGF